LGRIHWAGPGPGPGPPPLELTAGGGGGKGLRDGGVSSFCEMKSETKGVLFVLFKRESVLGRSEC